ncbi:MAG: beta-ketoacyl-ACP synthase II [Bacteroidia bacterium]|nr:beta-ketoacyl-ACP synthase II [Bacteroidia bacterium]MDW8333750.1 beta-ketoacyl-ACP synthase II [Bacteroidia bacterium]
MERIVVTGIGCLTPIGNGVAAYREGLKNGVSGAGPITRFDASKFRTRFACEVKNLDVEAYIPKKEVRRMDPFCHYALIAADQAVADAQINFDKIDKDRCGVVIGSGIGGLTTFAEEMTAFAKGDGTPRFNPFFIPKMIIDIAPGHISMKYGLRGPNYSCISACATATNCIIDAFLLLRAGMADMVLAGGSEAAVTETGIGGFGAMRALSERNDDPATASRPFDKDRDGFVLGEGSAVLVLETLSHALNRGARIYAEMAGVGMSADAYHLTAPEPEGRGAALVMQRALQSAGVLPQDVDYINVHGTSTPLGDVAETKAIKAVFGEHAYKVKISSTKSMTGHLLGAAGAVEAVAAILAVHDGFIPPTINHFTDDPECDLDYTFNRAVFQPVRCAISNTFGFGGHNATVVFKRYEE